MHNFWRPPAPLAGPVGDRWHCPAPGRSFPQRIGSQTGRPRLQPRFVGGRGKKNEDGLMHFGAPDFLFDFVRRRRHHQPRLFVHTVPCPRSPRRCHRPRPQPPCCQAGACRTAAGGDPCRPRKCRRDDEVRAFHFFFFFFFPRRYDVMLTWPRFSFLSHPVLTWKLCRALSRLSSYQTEK